MPRRAGLAGGLCRRQLLLHLLERLDRLVLHRGTHIVHREPRPCEQRRQAAGRPGRQRDLVENAFEVLLGRLGVTTREPGGGEGALHPRVRGDHRASWIALCPQVVERLAEHVGERLRGRLGGGRARRPPPAGRQPHREPCDREERQHRDDRPHCELRLVARRVGAVPTRSRPAILEGKAEPAVVAPGPGDGADDQREEHEGERERHDRLEGAPPLWSAGRRVVAAEEGQRDRDENGADDHEDEKEAERRVDEALRGPPGAPAGAGGDGARGGDGDDPDEHDHGGADRERARGRPAPPRRVTVHAR